MNYKHSKIGNSSKSKSRRDGSTTIPINQRDAEARKAANHQTVERAFGEFFPQFGSSLGVSYDKSTGLIEKLNLARSVKSHGETAASTPQTIKWNITDNTTFGLIVAYALNGAYLPITPVGGEYEISSVFPTDWSQVLDPNGTFTTAPAANTPADIAFIEGNIAVPQPVSVNFTATSAEIEVQRFMGIVAWVSADVNHMFFMPPLTPSQIADYTQLFSFGVHDLTVR